MAKQSKPCKVILLIQPISDAPDRRMPGAVEWNHEGAVVLEVLPEGAKESFEIQLSAKTFYNSLGGAGGWFPATMVTPSWRWGDDD